VPGHTRYDYDVRIGDAERDATMVQLREHFAAGRLTLDELTERIDSALTAKTQRQIDNLVADLPRLATPTRARPERQAPPKDAGRFLVLALMLFAFATWILIMAWMYRHAYGGYEYGYGYGGPGFPPMGHR
jgi:Domain of unknown function (DUF1707)